MLKRLVPWCLAGLFLAPVAAKAQGTGCIAAECVPPPYLFIPERSFGGFSNGDYQPGQTFSPRFRGLLNEVRLGLHSPTPGDTTRVIAEIRAVAGEFPTSVILARAVVPGAPYVGGNLYPASFAGQNLLLDPGTRYAITLRSTGPQIIYILSAQPGCGPATGTGEPVHTYDGGVTWGYAWSPGERSFAYQVCLEPATAAIRSSWGKLKTLYR